MTNDIATTELEQNTKALQVLQSGTPQDLDKLQHLPSIDKAGHVLRTPWNYQATAQIIYNIEYCTITTPEAIKEDILQTPNNYLYLILSELELLSQGINPNNKKQRERITTPNSLYTPLSLSLQNQLDNSETLQEQQTTLNNIIYKTIHRYISTAKRSSNLEHIKQYYIQQYQKIKKILPTDKQRRQEQNQTTNPYNTNTICHSAIKSISALSLVPLEDKEQKALNVIPELVKELLVISPLHVLNTLLSNIGENCRGVREVKNLAKRQASEKYLAESVRLTGDIDSALAKASVSKYTKEGEEYTDYHTGVLNFITNQGKQLREHAAILERGKINQEEAPAIVNLIQQQPPKNIDEVRSMNLGELAEFEVQ